MQSQGRFYVGAGGTCPQTHLLPPDSIADRSDVISEVPKCSKNPNFLQTLAEVTVDMGVQILYVIIQNV